MVFLTNDDLLLVIYTSEQRGNKPQKALKAIVETDSRSKCRSCVLIMIGEKTANIFREITSRKPEIMEVSTDTRPNSAEHSMFWAICQWRISVCV